MRKGGGRVGEGRGGIYGFGGVFLHTQCYWKLNILKTNDRSVFTLPFESSPSFIVRHRQKSLNGCGQRKKDIVVE